MRYSKKPTTDVFKAGFNKQLNRGMDNEAVDTYKLGASDKEYLKKLLEDVDVFGVNSVNGETGNVTLNTDDVDEGGTNLYYTDERARDAAQAMFSSSTSITVAVSDPADTVTIDLNTTYTDAIYARLDGSTFTGAIELSGDARVEKCITVGVEGFKAPGSNAADEVDVGITYAWAFDDSVQEYVVTAIDLPLDMDRSVAPTLKVHWAANDTSDDAVWQLEYLYREEDEDVTAAAQETLTGTATSSATADGLVETEVTGIDTPSTDDKLMMIRISRKAGDANDTLTGDINLFDIQICYTANKLGGATA